MSTTHTQARTPRQRGVLLATAFMLFSMFFGAGNLIFPPMLGALAGHHFTSAIVGFLIAGVLMPVLTTVAVAVSGADVSDLSRRAGRVFGWLFPVLVYLAIGPLYAMPRMGSVAYNTAFVPVTGVNSTAATIVFNLLFFGIALMMAWNSTRILDSVGRILTPLLLSFLTILIVRSLMILQPTEHAPAAQYAEQPLVYGLLQGYLTMDSIAALAFGIIVIRALRKDGGVSDQHIVPQTALAAIIAAALLAVVYVGLGLIGYSIPHPTSYENGALLLSDAASLTMGGFGRVIFGLTVLAACLTTAVGLLSACSGFFNRLLPKIPYHVWLVSFAAITAILAIQGLGVLLNIAGPLIGFLYPIGLTLVALTLLAPLFAGTTSLPITFKLAAGVAFLWSALSTVYHGEFLPALLGEIGTQAHSFLGKALMWAPMETEQLGWLTPVAIAIVAGIAVDVFRGNNR